MTEITLLTTRFLRKEMAVSVALSFFFDAGWKPDWTHKAVLDINPHFWLCYQHLDSLNEQQGWLEKQPELYPHHWWWVLEKFSVLCIIQPHCTFSCPPCAACVHGSRCIPLYYLSEQAVNGGVSGVAWHLGTLINICYMWLSRVAGERSQHSYISAWAPRHKPLFTAYLVQYETKEITSGSD